MVGTVMGQTLPARVGEGSSVGRRLHGGACYRYRTGAYTMVGAWRRRYRVAMRDGSGESGFVATGVVVQLTTFAIINFGWLVLHSSGVKFARDYVLGDAVFTAIVVAAASGVLTAIQRNRFRSLGVDIPRVSHGRWRRFTGYWRRLGYHLVVAPVLAAYVVAAMIALGVGYVLAAPVRLVRRGRRVSAARARTVEIIAQLDVWAGSAMLGPDRLWRRVEELTESRAGVVEAADAERRRIERDLHDGAQQRLVSLAMNLGVARTTLPDLPDDARQVIVEAHEEAKEALAELRALVRGLHPAILDDRGLDAAVSGIAARMPVPVRLRVELADRPSATVEAIAYFVVAEALANVTKHARAGHVEIELRRRDDVLAVTVTDDGVGGADPARGSGLTGLAQRVRSVDGFLAVYSPAGGPTTVRAELPCAS